MNKIEDKVLSVLANNFGNKRALGRRAMYKTLMELSIKVHSSKTILDLGCGSGRLLIPLAKLYPKKKFVGVDISDEMLLSLRANLVKESITNVEIIKADFDNGWVENLGNRKFDLVIFFQSIHFISSLDKFVGKVGEILTPKGVVIIASTNHEQFYRLPYCLASEKVLRMELSRTPDEPMIIQEFIKRSYVLANRVLLTVKKKFDSNQLDDWAKSKPFSALAYLTDDEFKMWHKNFLAREGKRSEILVDKMVLLTFERTD